MSVIHGQLRRHGVRLVGVGLEETGLDEFVSGRYFSGDLFIDSKQASYAALNAKRHGYFSIWPSVFGSKGRQAMSQAKQLGIAGDMRGDGFLMGGTIVVSARGDKLLLHFKQDGPADHVDNADILKALGIDEPADKGDEDETENKEGATCDDGVCSVK